jgi:DNA-binding XRE family transcriptional regulator
MTYYFDALPLHPPPEHLESFTSYLMRLAELNGISSLDGLSALCFQHQDRRITRDIADYTPTSLNDLARVSTWSEEVLRTTTFFHLAANFERSALPQPMSRFLAGSIGQYLRYCPLCFAEQGVRHYLLTWRFLIVTCCYKHQCKLLESCGHCGTLIPLFKAPFTLGVCQRCLKDLKLCNAALVLNDVEFEKSHRVHNDIVFLLTPQSWESENSKTIKQVGRWLSYTRQMKRLTAVEVARRIGVTLSTVEGIERGDFHGRGATLLSYFKYADCLCLDLKEVFSSVRNPPEDVSTRMQPQCPTCRDDSSITRCGHNRSGSQRYQCHCCHRSFTPLPKTHQL